MRSSLLFLTLALALPAMFLGQDKLPMMRSVDKMEALRGDIVTASGEKLGKAVVAELLLTTGKDDVKVKILEQTDTAIKFEVGADTKFAHYALMVLTAGDTPAYVEQPVKINVVEKLTPQPEAAPPAPAEPAAPQPPGR